MDCSVDTHKDVTLYSVHTTHCFFLPNTPLLPSPFSLSPNSIGATFPFLLHALFAPLFLPLLTSLLDAQQQHSPIINNHPTIAQPLAIHMNTNISTPIFGTIFTDCSAPLITLLNMMNITVAMMEAAVVNRAERKVRIAIGKVAQRVKTERGVKRVERKVRQAPVRKRANIQWEARRTSWRAEIMLAGRATVGGTGVSNRPWEGKRDKETGGLGGKEGVERSTTYSLLQQAIPREGSQRD